MTVQSPSQWHGPDRVELFLPLGGTGSGWPLTWVLLGIKVRWPWDMNNSLVWGCEAVSRNVKTRCWLNSCGKNYWNILPLFLG